MNYYNKYIKDTRKSFREIDKSFEKPDSLSPERIKGKNQLVNSLLDQISKCNDIIKLNQELSKNNVKLLENKTLIKQDRFIETTTTTNKESKNQGKK